VEDEAAVFSESEEREFVSLLVSHQSLIRAFVISLMPGSPEVEDVVQNTCQVLWIKRRMFTLGTNFKAWALTTARFQVMAQQQRLKAERRAPLDDDVLEMISGLAEQMDAKETNRRFEDLQDCLSLLTIRDQELILHRYWKRAGLAEYAKASGRSVGSLKVTLYRIRDSLRDCLERKFEWREGRT
jgi:RNA polymerase sigma-70 factor, ECF subfamily